jgi:hypothetical protein
MSNSPALDSSLSPSVGPSILVEELQRAALRDRAKVSKTQVVIVVGPPGYVSRSLPRGNFILTTPRIGKSSMILANQAKWRCECSDLRFCSNKLTLSHIAHGLWGQAKFQNVDSAPFAALVRGDSTITNLDSSYLS